MPVYVQKYTLQAAFYIIYLNKNHAISMWILQCYVLALNDICILMLVQDYVHDSFSIVHDSFSIVIGRMQKDPVKCVDRLLTTVQSYRPHFDWMLAHSG